MQGRAKWYLVWGGGGGGEGKIWDPFQGPLKKNFPETKNISIFDPPKAKRPKNFVKP